MMPHEQCQQSGCWLNFLQSGECPLPKFHFGQSVELVWFSEEENREMVDRGFVVGMVLDHPDFFIPGWWYFVKLTHMNERHLRGMVDSCSEDELRAIDTTGNS